MADMCAPCCVMPGTAPAVQSRHTQARVLCARPIVKTATAPKVKADRPLLDHVVDLTVQFVAATEGRKITSSDALQLMQEQSLRDRPGLYAHINENLRELKVPWVLSAVTQGGTVVLLESTGFAGTWPVQQSNDLTRSSGCFDQVYSSRASRAIKDNPTHSEYVLDTGYAALCYAVLRPQVRTKVGPEGSKVVRDCTCGISFVDPR
jgi:hypothetical protein